MIAFASPWLLAALFALPALWWWLRLTPPAPRQVRFPPLALLRHLTQGQDSAARTPWWMLLLRLLALALLIAASAEPVLHPKSPISKDMPLVLVMDDGWSSAADWPARRQAAEQVLTEAGRNARPVWLLTTAAAADGSPPHVQGLMTATAALALTQALTPKPWPTDQAIAAAAIRAMPHDRVAAVTWIGDGIDAGHAQALAQALQGLGGGVTLLSGQNGHLLRRAADNGTTPGFTITRVAGGPEQLALRGLQHLALRAKDDTGQVLARQEFSLTQGQHQAQVTLSLPTQLRNRLARLDIEGENSAATTLLLDDQWKRHLVGLVGADTAGAPLLSSFYYIERALAPQTEMVKGNLDDLVQRHADALILVDQPLADPAGNLGQWVEGGGVLIRFAGPATAHAISAGSVPDGLMPVRLRAGGRSLGGALSWSEAQGLAPFPAASPLAGLDTDAEIRVSAQVLAEPDGQLSERIWAQLTDGTPLITGQKRGKGWLVLIHTSANADWSNLALSGLFPPMLSRLIALGQGGGADPAGPLPPGEVIDGFGRNHPAGAMVQALPAAQAARRISPQTPPGLYGPPGGRIAFNLSPSLPDPTPFVVPPGIAIAGLGQQIGGRALAGPVLAAVLVLLILDLLAGLALRGLWRRRAVTVLILTGLTLIPDAAPRAAEDFAMKAGLTTRLAFIRTGDDFIDGKARAGLTALSRVVEERSTAHLGTPMEVVLDRDPILFFPIVYWSLSDRQPPPSAAAVAKLNAYMKNGGLIVLDTGGEAANAPDPAVLQTLTQGLALPPLGLVGSEHVLARSFYLLKDLPGRWDGPVWVGGTGSDDNDGVSPVVVGGNDWVGAWAEDGQGRPSFPCVPGGERQRELAWRFGVNLVIYALTGNYKADQVHLPAILERLGQ